MMPGFFLLMVGVLWAAQRVGHVCQTGECYHKMIARWWPACYRHIMNKAQRRTLEAIFSQPVPATLGWRRIELLFLALGAQVIEGDG